MATSFVGKLGSAARGALILVAVGVAVGGAHSWKVQAGDSPVKLRVDASANQGVVLGGETDTPDDTGPRVLGYEIDTDDAYALWEGGLAVFADARSIEEYEAGHIGYARFLDYKNLYDTPFPPLLDELLMDTTQPVVFYCNGGDCDSSHNAAAYFQELGFTTVHVYLDGYPGWVEAGYETESGPDPFAE